MNLTVGEIKKLLKNWHFYKAYILNLQDGGELKRKIDAIEKAINALEECDAVIIRKRYFERTEMDIVAADFFITRQAVYKRLETILKRMAFCIVSCG